MRKILLALTLTVLGSCGGGPMAPSTAAPSTPASLDSGSYLLTVSMSTSGTSGFSSCVSLTIQGTPPPSAARSAATPAHVERAGTSVTITPDDPSATFRMQLQIASANLSGTASGQYRSSATPIAVVGRAAGTPAAATGTIGPVSASGVLEGAVSVDAMTCTNNGHAWSLTPR